MIVFESLVSVSYLSSMKQKPLGPIFTKVYGPFVNNWPLINLDLSLKKRSKVKLVFTQEFIVRICLIWAQDKEKVIGIEWVIRYIKIPFLTLMERSKVKSVCSIGFLGICFLCVWKNDLRPWFDLERKVKGERCFHSWVPNKNTSNLSTRWRWSD